MYYQCAWCGSLVMDGLKVSEPEPINNKLSHGICTHCRTEVEKDYLIRRKILKSSTPLLMGNVC